MDTLGESLSLFGGDGPNSSPSSPIEMTFGVMIGVLCLKEKPLEITQIEFTKRYLFEFLNAVGVFKNGVSSVNISLSLVLLAVLWKVFLAFEIAAWIIVDLY